MVEHTKCVFSQEERYIENNNFEILLRNMKINSVHRCRTREHELLHVPNGTDSKMHLFEHINSE